jgi:hypothetical protein
MFANVTYCGMSEVPGALALTGVDSLCRIWLSTCCMLLLNGTDSIAPCRSMQTCPDAGRWCALVPV